MNASGTPQVWCVPLEGGWPQQVTFFDDRVAEVSFSPCSDHILFSKDQGGNEHHQLYLVRPDGTGLRELTDCPRAIHTLGRWSHDGRWLGWASNREHPAHFGIYVQEVNSGAVEQVFTASGTHQVLAWSPHDDTLLLSRVNSNLDNDLLVLDLGDRSVAHLTPHEGEAQYGHIAWAQEAEGFYLLTSEGSEFTYLAYYDLDELSLRRVFATEHNVELLRLSPDGSTLAFSVNEEGYSRLFLLDEGQRQPRPVEGFPPAVVTGLEWSRDGENLVVALDGSCHNPNLWVYDTKTKGSRQLTYAAWGGVDPTGLVEPELVHYTSFDGLTIPSFYYRPREGKGPYPVVIDIHGGPESQRRVNFNPITQYLVSAGYAVFAPNVRGSAGYGKRYLHLDDVRRRMDAVKDIASAVSWLVKEGGADEDRLAVMGGSYGGFMVLACITEYPQLWAGAIDIVGIANFVTFLERTGPWRRYLRESEYGSLERDRDFLVSISPLHKAHRIVAPLMVIHGANDPRVPVEEAEQIVAAVQERQGVVEYLRYEDEGHGLVKLKNRVDAYPRVVAFLDRFVRKAGS